MIQLHFCARELFLSDMRTVCVGLSVNGIFHWAMMEDDGRVSKSATTMTSSSIAMYQHGHHHVLILQALPNLTVYRSHREQVIF